MKEPTILQAYALMSDGSMVQIEPSRRGRWLPIKKPYSYQKYIAGYKYECSECELWAPSKTPFCPQCGAKMEEGE